MSSPSPSGYVPRDLVPIARLPSQFRSIFPNYVHFNRIQSKIFPDVYLSDSSIVVSAPTGSGKTVIFELAILKLLASDEQSLQKKMIYVSPLKALCEERFQDWRRRFGQLNVQSATVTGDNDDIQLKDLMAYQIIITTPEKWDSLTRQWRTYRTFVQSVSLFMIDEVHLLGDSDRGPVLEAIVSRMKTMQTSYDSIRFVAASATIPNAQDISAWFGCKARDSKCFEFGEEMRPVKLTKLVYGFPNYEKTNVFKFDINLNYKLANIIMQHSNGKPTLIFCSTRKSVEMACKQIAQSLTLNLSTPAKMRLREAATSLTNPLCRASLIAGVGAHHAGIATEDRHVVEQLFRGGHLPVLVTTSTLAMGVNLPAHLVIVKNTKYYVKGEYRNYSTTLLLQMIGRAGRPQFDTSATAVIMTSSAEKSKFEGMIGGSEPIESNLHSKLTEHLNSEIVLHTLTDLGTAMEWISSTYLYIRARKNPRFYRFVGSAGHQQQQPHQIDAKLIELCQIEINKLASTGMINIDENVTITPTQMGALMAKFYLRFETMKLFTELRGNESLFKLLCLISKCDEFSDLFLRVSDKKPLNMLNSAKNREVVRFPVSGKISSVDMKVNCLIQAVFGTLEIMEPSLMMEAEKVIRIGERVSKCLLEYLTTIRQQGNILETLVSAVILNKCFACKLWEDTPYVAKQLPGIGFMRARALAQAGKTTFDAILGANPRQLEIILHRKPPLGDDILEQVRHLPNYQVKLVQISLDMRRATAKVTVQLCNVDALEDVLGLQPESLMTLIVGNETTNEVILRENFTHNYMVDNPLMERRLPIVFSDERETKLCAHFISENWVGFDSSDKLSLFPNQIRRNEANTVQAARVIPKRRPKLTNSTIDEYFQKTRFPRKKSAEKKVSANNLAAEKNKVESRFDDSDDLWSEHALNAIEEQLLMSSDDELKLNSQVKQKQAKLDERKKSEISKQLSFEDIFDEDLLAEFFPPDPKKVKVLENVPVASTSWRKENTKNVMDNIKNVVDITKNAVDITKNKVDKTKNEGNAWKVVDNSRNEDNKNLLFAKNNSEDSLEDKELLSTKGAQNIKKLLQKNFKILSDIHLQPKSVNVDPTRDFAAKSLTDQSTDVDNNRKIVFPAEEEKQHYWSDESVGFSTRKYEDFKNLQENPFEIEDITLDQSQNDFFGMQLAEDNNLQMNEGTLFKKPAMDVAERVYNDGNYKVTFLTGPEQRPFDENGANLQFNEAVKRRQFRGNNIDDIGILSKDDDMFTQNRSIMADFNQQAEFGQFIGDENSNPFDTPFDEEELFGDFQSYATPSNNAYIKSQSDIFPQSGFFKSPNKEDPECNFREKLRQNATSVGKTINNDNINEAKVKFPLETTPMPKIENPRVEFKKRLRKKNNLFGLSASTASTGRKTSQKMYSQNPTQTLNWEVLSSPPKVIMTQKAFSPPAACTTTKNIANFQYNEDDYNEKDDDPCSSFKNYRSTQPCLQDRSDFGLNVRYKPMTQFEDVNRDSLRFGRDIYNTTATMPPFPDETFSPYDGRSYPPTDTFSQIAPHLNFDWDSRTQFKQSYFEPSSRSYPFNNENVFVAPKNIEAYNISPKSQVSRLYATQNGCDGNGSMGKPQSGEYSGVNKRLTWRSPLVSQRDPRHFNFNKDYFAEPDPNDYLNEPTFDTGSDWGFSQKSAGHTQFLGFPNEFPDDDELEF